MPARLRPIVPPAADAVLVGDPGRALLLAQELLERPTMSNHARGLWGYTGTTREGRPLTIQATGMGGPSAAIVLADLAELGLERAVRIGTCTGLAPRVRVGELLLVGAALAGGGSAASFGVEPGGVVRPDRRLTGDLRQRLGDAARTDAVTSLDAIPTPGMPALGEAHAADMQTLAVLARGAELGVAVAALLIVTESGRRTLADEALEAAAKRAGAASVAVLST